MADTTTYIVEGMTCDHCATSVAERVRPVSGVTAVEVDLASKRVVVTGDGVSDQAVRDAIAEAGYEAA